MKKRRIRQLSLLMLALTLVTTSLVSGTLAKYVTTVNGTGSVTVAKWNAVLTHKGAEYGPTSSTDTVTFDLFDNQSDTGVSDSKLIAPGTSGSFAFDFDTSGSQVARTIKITMKPTGTTSISDLDFLVFKNGTETINLKAGEVTLVEKDIAANASDAETKGTVTINWAWPFDNDNDVADTKDGIDAKTYSFEATFSATQVDGTPVAP